MNSENQFRIILFVFLIYSLNLFGFCVGNREQCVAKNGSKCKSGMENKYSAEANSKWNQYLKIIQDAEQKYIPCDSNKCNCFSHVMTDDLKPFDKGITKEMMNRIKEKGTRYQIVDGKLYRDKNCMFPARCLGIEHFILNLLSKSALPNMEFFVNTRDWPQINKNYGVFGPVFSFSKIGNEYYDIMYPAWAFWEGGPAISLYPRGIGRWDLLRNELGRKANETPWDQKFSKGFFRGSRTSAERDPLVLLSREYPNLVDAHYTKNQAWKSDADTLHAPPAPEVSFADHCNYKYLFNFRGVAASFRFKHILLCKSLVFHVGNDWLEFFYPSMKPWIHYVPIDSNANKETLKGLIEFFKEHDGLAEKIANNGFEFIWNHLKMQDVQCYWRRLLRKYAKLLRFEVSEVDNDLILIKH